MVTLGVADLPRATAFYRALGWHGQEVQETVFFQAGGMAIVLWSWDKLAEDCGLPANRGTGIQGADFHGIALAQNVRSAAEVDEVMVAAEAASVTVTKPAATTFYGGYAGYFLDPDGHAWEVAYNPRFTLLDDGSLVLPDFGA